MTPATAVGPICLGSLMSGALTHVVTEFLRSRMVARAAVVALTLGLASLASLAAWSINSTAEATSTVRQMNHVSDAWSRVFEALVAENEALSDYLRAGSDAGRTPLVSVLDSAQPDLVWLTGQGSSADRSRVARFRETYASYTSELRQLVAATNARDGARVAALAQVIDLGASSLRKQVSSNSNRQRVQTAGYLVDVNQKNGNLRVWAAVACGVDVLLLILCALILLAHQRRVERQAVESRHGAMHDALTGIANRVLLNDRITIALKLAQRQNRQAALLVLDLNRFKEVNDTLGHHYGDLLLQEVAQRLTAAVRDSDTVARLGGDEFAVVLQDVGTADQAVGTAGRLLTALQRSAELDGVTVDVSASVGIALYPLHGTSSGELLQHADIAMYAAKRGLLGVAMYEPESDHHNREQLTIVSELRHAIDSDELVLHYQPKVHAGSGQVVGVEALVRWQHPLRGLLGPEAFVPVAESSGLIHPLTAYVLRSALEQHDEWRRLGMVVPLAVNIASQSLLDEKIVDLVEGALAGSAATPDQLTLEITETALITDPAAAAAVLDRLRDRGVRLSLDDFGTGYASMAYLQTIPVSELKIDRSFVTTMESSGSNMAIVHAVLQLGHALGLDVVGEGVEDESTRVALHALGCEVVQGYHVARPMSAADMTAWLTARPMNVPARVGGE